MTMGKVEQRFAVALEGVMEQPLDRRVVLILYRTGHEVRYMELWRAAGQPHKQVFKDSIERLVRHALVNRRLEEQGERYATFLSPSPRGNRVAEILLEASKAVSRLLVKVEPKLAESAGGVFLGETAAPSS